jgi:DNA mismatch repair ATPase MutS
MLRANLLQPLCDRDAIEDRLDTVYFLLKNPSLSELLKADIARFKMLEPISVKFIQQPKPDPRSLKSYIYYILLMSHFISSLDHLRSRLESWMAESQPV